jgi:hypothetical protein
VALTDRRMALAESQSAANHFPRPDSSLEALALVNAPESGFNSAKNTSWTEGLVRL